MATTTVPGHPAVLDGSGDHGTPAHAKTGFWTLVLGSVGVVYGDIGTSPLYALKESLVAASAGGALTRGMVFGVVSLVLWALIVIVTLKYVLLILRMDNDGEGGTLTLMALVQRVTGRGGAFVTLLGMAGAALFYGDAVITPAISVLSAVEGLELVTPAFKPYVLP
jgi:KUP system potassium uptake protein